MKLAKFVKQGLYIFTSIVPWRAAPARMEV